MRADDVRSRVLELVRGVPGVHISEVARAVGVDASTAEYHLRRLSRGGVVVSEVRGRSRRWFVNGCGFCPVLRAAVPWFREEGARRVMVALAEGGGERPVELAARAGVGRSSVRWALQQGAVLGLVEASGFGRFRLAPGADACVRHAAESTVCGRWGRCAVSRRWAAADQGNA